MPSVDSVLANAMRLAAGTLEVHLQVSPADFEVSGAAVKPQHWRAVETVQITSDEPWIPWELIRPYDDRDPNRIVDDFLCHRFQLTRWLAGDGGGAGQISIRRLACIDASVVPNHAALAHAAEEREVISALAERHGIEMRCPVLPTVEAVEALLDEGAFGHWHFTGHGHLDPENPDEAPLVLSDGMLRPSDIHGPRQSAIRRERPLVFLNACRVGGSGWPLTGLGGWAAKLVGQARCGAFIAPQWAVDDGLAATFACAIYEALEQGKTMGEAAQAARERLRGLAPSDPTWLAYSVYAHPNARIASGG